MADVDALLSACLSNDNQARQAAEATLKVLSKDPQIVTELLVRIKTATDPSVRALAAVLLRRRISTHWQVLPDAVKQQAKAQLLEQIAGDQHHSVRRAVADVVSAIARLTVPKNEWNELLGFLQQCSTSTSASHREIALTLFASLTETIGTYLQPHFASLQLIVLNGLGDSQEVVRLAALRAMDPLAELATGEAEIRLFHTLVQAVLQMGAAALQSGSEDVAGHVFLLLTDLCEKAAPLLQPGLPDVVSLAASAAGDSALELETREQAIQLIVWVARCKPKQLAKQKDLVRRLVDMLCSMMCEPVAETDGAVSKAEEEVDPRTMASQALDVLAIHVLGKDMIPLLIERAKGLSASPNADHRTAAMLILAVTAEGCAEYYIRKLKDVLPTVLNGLRDADKSVRAPAAFAVGQFSEYLLPDILRHYETVLPGIFYVMHDPTPDVQERACYALDTFCENLDKAEILPYLPELMTKLGDILRTDNADIQETAMSAIASTIAAAGNAFDDYAVQLLPILQHFMQAPASREDLMPIRYRATECFGLLLEYVAVLPAPVGQHAPLSAVRPTPAPGPGAAAVRAALPGAMTMALEGFAFGNPELCEFTYGMFMCAAKVMGEEFAPYLAQVVPLALQSCNQDDGTFEADDEDEEESGGEVNLGEISGSEDEEDAEHGRNISIRTGMLDEKCAATAMLGACAECCTTGFVPTYLPQCLEALDAMGSYFHEQVQVQAATSLASAVAATHRVYPMTPTGALSPQTQHSLGIAVPALNVMLDHSEKAVVTAALVGFAMLLRDLGVGALTGPTSATSLGALAETVKELLQGKAACQAGDGNWRGQDACEDEEEGRKDEDEEMLGALSELMAAVAAAAGPATYAPVFSSLHLPHLLQLMRPRIPHNIRAAAVGLIADVAAKLKVHLLPHVDAILPTLLRELKGEDSINRHNAAYAVGVLMEGGGAHMAGHVPTVLQALFPLFSSEEDPGARDNAVLAVARMLLPPTLAPGEVALSPSLASAVPLEQVLPVLLGGLPLKEDLAEAGLIYRALASLVTGDQAQRVAAFVPQILGAFGAATVQEDLPREAKVAAATAVATLRVQYAQHVDPILAALPADQQHALVLLAQQQ